MRARGFTKLSVASGTDIGLVRKTNQDTAYAWAPQSPEGVAVALLVVSDGIGGFEAGEVASSIAVGTVAESLGPYLKGGDSAEQLRSPVLEDRLYEAVCAANAHVLQYARDHLEGGIMGCTLTCMAIQGSAAVLAHVGDSRAYLLSSTYLEQLTRDHTPAGEYYKLGLINAEAVLYHPKRNLLTRALGLGPDLDVDVYSIELRAGDRLLLCTDGLWGYVPEIVIERLLLRAGTPRSAVRELIAAGNAFGGSDNIGVAVCEVSSGG